MIGQIIFYFGLALFLIAVGFWIYFGVQSHKCCKADRWHEELRYNRKMCFTGIFVALGALLVNIGNLVMKSLS